MSFQAYLDNIAAKTGKSPDDFSAMPREKGFCDETGLRPGVRVRTRSTKQSLAAPGHPLHNSTPQGHDLPSKTE
jgi:hypothetical protein